MKNKLNPKDLFLVTEQEYLFDKEEYNQEWPEEKENNLYSNIIKENGLNYCVELSKRYWLYGPVRLYSAKEISEDETYKWYEVVVYLETGPESSQANAHLLIVGRGNGLYEVKNSKKSLIY